MGLKRSASLAMAVNDDGPRRDATVHIAQRGGDPATKRVKFSDHQATATPNAVPAQISSGDEMESVTTNGDIGADVFEEDDEYYDDCGGDSDNDDSGEYNDLEDDCDELDDDPFQPTRRRKRSLSPPVLIPSEDWDWSSEPTVCDDMEEAFPTIEQENTKGTALQLTVNIPPGHRGPITLHIDPRHGMSSTLSAPFVTPRSEKTASDRKGALIRDTTNPRHGAGFLDLAAELRNQIYRLIFVTVDPFNFANPTNFSRSAALLRTCSQVYNEGRTILYSENQFIMKRRSTRYGSLWQPDWNELGFQPVRVFLKSIGANNTGLLRSIRLHLQDAVPCLNPSLHSHDVRRFVNDDAVMSVLRHLGTYARLQRLELFLQGRRRVQVLDERFLSALSCIKADEVAFVDRRMEEYMWASSKQTPRVETILLKNCTRVRKLYPEEGLMKAKPGYGRPFFVA